MFKGAFWTIPPRSQGLAERKVAETRKAPGPHRPAPTSWRARTFTTRLG